MIRFTFGADDPVEFDDIGLRYLSKRYSDILHEVRYRVNDSPWFRSFILERDCKHEVDWNVVARLLMCGFAAADALNVSPKELIDLWVEYTRFRILPLLSLDSAIDRGRGHSGCYEKPIYLSKVGLYNLAAQANGYCQMANTPRGTIFWSVYSRILNRVVQIVYEEMARRFDDTYIQNPHELLNVYETDLCPLLRSSALETIMIGIVEMKGLKLTSYNWLTLYEKMRQLLDDLADMREDLVVGRLTYPVLLALKKNEYKSELKTMITEVWAKARSGDTNIKISNYWLPIKSILKRSSALRDTCELIKSWNSTIRDSIQMENLPGNKDALLTMVELKAALLARMMENEFEDRAPQFIFFNR